MEIPVTAPLFAWGSLEDSPSLTTVRRLLACVPDGGLLESLRRHRGRGRNEYPVEVLWGVVLLTIALRHMSIEGCLGELRLLHLAQLVMIRILVRIVQIA